MMKRFVALIALATLFTDGAAAQTEPSQDGYALFSQACQYHESIDLPHDSAAWVELCDFVTKGSAPTANILALIQQEKPVFSLIEQASNEPVWELPDVSKYSASTTIPYISADLDISKVATAQASILFLEGKPAEALDFLFAFNEAGLRLHTSGTLIQALVYIAGRSMQYPAMISSIDALPDDLLADHLAGAKQQYARIPVLHPFLEGEHYMSINTAKGLFNELRKDPKLQAARNRMIKELEARGMEPEILAQLKADEILSVSQWEEQFLTHLSGLQSFYLSALATRPTDQLGQLDEAIEDRIQRIGTGVEYETALASWNLFMTNRVAGSFSVPDAERLHEQIGRALSSTLLHIFMPAASKAEIVHRRFLTTERLLLIRLATRLYVLKYKQPPESLQQLVDNQLLDPDMIIDELSGHPFLLNRQDGFSAYGVDRDLDDDGGTPWDNKSRSGDSILLSLSETWQRHQAASPDAP
jgi:hypothetical protein